MLSTILYGTRTSLMIGLCAVACHMVRAMKASAAAESKMPQHAVQNAVTER